MRAPAAAALAALLAACAPQPTQPPPEGLPAEFPAAYYEQLRAQGKPVYQVDPARSLVVIEVRRGGTLACSGIHMSPIPSIDYDRELFGERTLRSVTANTRADGIELLAEAARIGLRPRTTTYPLERASDALIDLAEGRVRGAAVLVV